MENIEKEISTTESSESGTVLVVTSKVKKYIKAAAGMNTAGDVAEALTSVVMKAIDKAITSAKDAGRKTVMAKDISLID